jgi:hypothetical protein
VTWPKGDDALLGMLGQAVARYDRVPDSVMTAARAASSMVSLETELATLTYDSSFRDEDTRALVRGSRGGSRELTFEAPSLTIEVQVHTVERRLLGQLVPPGPAMVEVRSPGSSVSVEADDLGRFAADIPTGPVSLRCRPEARPATDTEWVIL